MSSKNRPRAVPDPGPTWPAMTSTVQSLKEHVDVWAGDRGDVLDSVVTYRDLIAMGILRESDLAVINLRKRAQ